MPPCTCMCHLPTQTDCGLRVMRNPSAATPTIAGWPENSLFRNHVIKDRVKTQVSGMRPAFVCVASQVMQ